MVLKTQEKTDCKHEHTRLVKGYFKKHNLDKQTMTPLL